MDPKPRFTGAVFPTSAVSIWDQLMATGGAQARFPSCNIILRTQVKFNLATLAI